MKRRWKRLRERRDIIAVVGYDSGGRGTGGGIEAKFVGRQEWKRLLKDYNIDPKKRIALVIYDGKFIVLVYDLYAALVGQEPTNRISHCTSSCTSLERKR